MPGIPRELAEHSLRVHEDARPVKQTMRRFSGPKRDAISKEIDRLLHAGFIREIKDSDWVANPVLVEKKKTKKLQIGRASCRERVRLKPAASSHCTMLQIGVDQA